MKSPPHRHVDAQFLLWVWCCLWETAKTEGSKRDVNKDRERMMEGKGKGRMAQLGPRLEQV